MKIWSKSEHIVDRTEGKPNINLHRVEHFTKFLHHQIGPYLISLGDLLFQDDWMSSELTCSETNEH